ncbi:protein ALP1-like [Athalia rosae]|uniref:protein ALP1-like n=1 Tax=Athalia rosae TaxID=37344 RepID=UPI0020337D81|nr:protein ALP1-like [Athalia rosae]
MDAETLLISISVLWIKWRKIRQPSQQRIMRRKLLKLLTMHEFMEAEEHQRPRRFWVRPIFELESRLRQGASNNLVREMLLHDHEKYITYFRMTPECFEKLLALTGPNLTKKTVVRTPISARTRLEIVLRYLASGDSMVSISFAFRIGNNTASKIIAEGCEEIWRCLKDTVFLVDNAENWTSVAEDFEAKWNFPNCIGAIDGKHVTLQAPANSGSTFYNYKGSHSIVLLACSDAHYRFTLVDIGAEGRQSDGGVFRNSEMGGTFEGDRFQLPSSRAVSSDGPILPYVLVADEAFPLTEYMMRPYPRSRALDRRKKVFNYRLSRARRVVESAFGILAAKWRIFRKPIEASVPTAKKIVQAACCLHNYILSYEAETPLRPRFYSTLSTDERCATSLGLSDIQYLGPHTRSRHATQIREDYATFFEGAGAVPWQWERAMQNDF